MARSNRKVVEKLYPDLNLEEAKAALGRGEITQRQAVKIERLITVAQDIVGEGCRWEQPL